MNDLKDVEKAVAHVKKTAPGDRTAVVRSYLDGRVHVGPPIIEANVGKGVLRRDDPLVDRAGAALLHRRALFVTELGRANLWPCG